MNTILTDDEIHKWWASENGMEDADMAKLNDFREVTRKVETAVLAKLREQEPVAWLVCSINKDGSPSLEYAAAWKEAAHEHINDAITEHEIEDAASWVVRPAYAAPQPAVVQVPQGVDVEGRRIAAEAENHACSLAVWMTRMDAESPDADDLGVSGWLQEAEERIKRRMLAAAPEAPAQEKSNG